MCLVCKLFIFPPCPKVIPHNFIFPENCISPLHSASRTLHKPQKEEMNNDDHCVNYAMNSTTPGHRQPPQRDFYNGATSSTTDLTCKNTNAPKDPKILVTICIYDCFQSHPSPSKMGSTPPSYPSELKDLIII